MADLKEAFGRLCEIVAQLRAPGGCSWDREQTHESLLPPLLEEAYEIASAIRARDDANFEEELGDLLLIIVMHAEIAREEGRFEIEQVIRGITAKLIRRHPHVFGESNARATDAVLRQWERIKHEEKSESTHYLDGLPQALPALMRAQKAQNKAARVNFDWSDPSDVLAKVEEEFAEVKSALAAGDKGELKMEMGDLLFAVVNLARKHGFSAEELLSLATDKFVARFNSLEDEVRAQGKKLGESNLAELDEIWNRLKAERPAPQESTGTARA